MRISDWSSDVCSSDLRIVGVTCHASRHLAMEAAEAGADYVAFGAFFPTGTKAAKTRADPEIIEWWAGLMEAPCVAIGGITVENCGPLGAAGADFLAGSGGVRSEEDTSGLQSPMGTSYTVF